MKCTKCGRPDNLHDEDGLCPIGSHVELNANTVDRAKRTGHPRLVANVLSGTVKDQAFSTIHIDNLRIAEAE